MTKNPVNDIDLIVEQKLKVCNDLLSATVLLKEALEKEETVSVDGLIRRREDMVHLIDAFDHRIGEYWCEHPFDSSRLGTKLSEGLDSVLKRLVSLNQDCVAVAAAKCEGLRKDMAIVHQTGSGIRGYARGTQRVQKFLDIET